MVRRPSSAAKFPLRQVGSSFLQSTIGALPTPNPGATDAFVGSFDLNDFSLNWSTLLGGGEDEAATAITTATVNGHHYIYLGGLVNSETDNGTYPATPLSSYGPSAYFPLVNPGGGAYFQSTHNNSNGTINQDGFISCFDDNKKLSWSTYFGSADLDRVLGMCHSSGGDLYINGYTATTALSSNQQAANTQRLFPVYHNSAAYTQALGGHGDAFLARFSADTHQLQWSTVFGGVGNDDASLDPFTSALQPVTVDGLDHLYVCGSTQLFTATTGDMPVVQVTNRYNQAHNASYGVSADLASAEDGWMAEFDTKNALKWSTHFGGDVSGGQFADPNAQEHLSSIACLSGTETQVYCAGVTRDTQTPTWDPGSGAYYDGSYNTGQDAVVCRFANMTSTKVNTLTTNAVGIMQVIPNPSAGMYDVVVSYENYAMAGEQQLTVTDITGKKVLAHTLKPTSAHTDYKIDIRNQPAGVYLLRVSGRGFVQSAKLIKY